VNSIRIAPGRHRTGCGVLHPQQRRRPIDQAPAAPARLPSNQAGLYFAAGQTPRSELFEVFLDDVRLPMCIKAHSGQGWATCYVIDEATGNVAVDGLGNTKTRTLHGRVRIRRTNG